MKKLPFFVILCFVISLLVTGQVFAATLYFSPQSAALGQNQDFQIDVGLNTEGESVNAVTADFFYPADKLEVNTVNVNDNILPIVAERGWDGGVVSVSGGNITPFSGGLVLASVNFKVKANSGTGTLNFTQDAAVVGAADQLNVLSKKEAANFTFWQQSKILAASQTGVAVDLNALVANWGSTNVAFDLNKNGSVDIFDLSIVLTYGEN